MGGRVVKKDLSAKSDEKLVCSANSIGLKYKKFLHKTGRKMGSCVCVGGAEFACSFASEEKKVVLVRGGKKKGCTGGEFACSFASEEKKVCSWLRVKKKSLHRGKTVGPPTASSGAPRSPPSVFAVSCHRPLGGNRPDTTTVLCLALRW